MDYIILVISLAIIIVGAMLLTDGSVAVARRFRVPEFVVGLTIMAVGTSMPELTVSFMSAINGHGEMAIGNVVGSNIFNVFAILGVCALFSPIVFTRTNVRRDIPMCIIATLMLTVMTLIGGNISHLEGAILLISYVAMIIYMIRAEKSEAVAVVEESAPAMPTWRIPVWIVLGLAGLIFGGDIFVESASNIARAWGVSEATIAITLVAGGTSMPELASSLVSILKGKTSLALGNVLGSNIANILLILGLCGSTTPLTMGGVAMTDIYVALAAAGFIMLSALVIGRDKLTRFEGAVFVACYVGYVYTLLC